MVVQFDDPGVRTAARLPRRRDAWLFAGKVAGLQLLRWLRDVRSGPRRQRRGPLDAGAVTESRSSLWPAEDVAGVELVAGKIHNLRLAVRRLHGLYIPAGEVFGFWRQLGRATRRRGYARGRELREGCVVPSIGGGLCQLSNAIYDAALRHGLDIVERHRHSRVIPGSLAERDRDAVVFWNYLDLRLRAPFAWRLECWLDGDQLRVRILSAHPAPVNARSTACIDERTQPNGDCSSCGQIQCHRHAPSPQVMLPKTWLVEDDWPEFFAYRQRGAAADDRRIMLANDGLSTLLTRLRRRIARWRGTPLPRQRLDLQRRRARRFAQHLHAQDVELVVPQSLLPWLWQAGELQGRRFDVLMTALPMHHLHAVLDRAAASWPRSSTLTDFRADRALVEAERLALAHARRWIGPHRQVLALAGMRAELLPWSMPSRSDRRPAVPRRVTLAASALARKGAVELEEALRGLEVELCLPPGAGETPAQWAGLAVVRAPDWTAAIAQAELVVLPAWVEHQPRGLLMAMQLGIPVVATPECGLAPDDARWIAVAAGDAAALRAAICAVLGLAARGDPLNASSG